MKNYIFMKYDFTQQPGVDFGSRAGRTHM